MKRRINPFASDYPANMRQFARSVYNNLHSGQQQWIASHGDLSNDELDYLSGAALEELWELTNGDASLVTHELVQFVYDGIEPDPEVSLKKDRL